LRSLVSYFNDRDHSRYGYHRRRRHFSSLNLFPPLIRPHLWQG
jgi:hypothetical protein